MAKVPDPKVSAGEATKAPDAAAPLEFEKISMEDAKRSFDSGRGVHHESAADHHVGSSDDMVLHDATAAWFGQLPARVRPLEVGRRYRRIANRLCELWQRRTACENYFNELLSGGQADRKQLPPEIVAELSALRVHYAQLHLGGRGILRDGGRVQGSGLSDAESLLAATVAWLEHLPERQRPLELSRRYPRIANKLCEIWKRPSICDRFLDELVIDRRGGRKGFPLKVAAELGELRAYYSRLYPSSHGAWKDGDFMA